MIELSRELLESIRLIFKARIAERNPGDAPEYANFREAAKKSEEAQSWLAAEEMEFIHKAFLSPRAAMIRQMESIGLGGECLESLAIDDAHNAKPREFSNAAT